MLSRVAERTYWLARYLERAENTARLINVYSSLLVDLPKSAQLDWDVVLAVIENDEDRVVFEGADKNEAILRYLLHDETNPVSLLATIKAVRENARTTRDIVPTEGWRAVNELCIYARESLPNAVDAGERAQIMSSIINRVHTITGLLAGTMSRGQPYQFVLLGRNVERADMTTRMIDVASAVLMTERPELVLYDKTLWMTVLRCLSAYQMYRQYVRRRVRGPDVIGFLLLDDNFPRAVNHCMAELSTSLNKLPRPGRSLERLSPMKTRLEELDIDKLSNENVHELVDALQGDIARVHDAIAATWHYPADVE